jgi:ABC-2 type transport system permease protein
MIFRLIEPDQLTKPSGIDFSQLKMLVRMAIRLSFRGYGSEFAQSERSIRSSFRSMIITYLITSIGLGALVTLCGNQITYNTLLISYGMMMTAFSILIEYNDLILNVDDAEILFTRPVSSQTVYWARLLTLVLFVLLYAAALLFLPAIASFHFDSSKLLLFPFVFIVMLLACVTSALGVVYLYAQLLKWVHPHHLTSWLTYFQTGFSLLLFYGYYRFLLYEEAKGQVSIAKAVENVQAAAASGINPFRLTLDRSTVFYFLPPAWFAGIIDLLLGNTRARAMSLALAALGLLTFVFCLLAKGVPGSYLAALTNKVLGGEAQPYSREIAPRTGQFNVQWVLRRLSSGLGVMIRILPPSTQSSYRLVSCYLRRDTRLRRGIYPFFGIILFYFVYAIDNPNFVASIFQASSTLDVLSTHPAFVLLPLCILIASHAAQYSSDWKAAWVFRAAPTTGLGFYLGYRLALFRGIYGPIWLAAFAFYWFHLNLNALFLQMVALLLIIQFLLSLSFLFDPHLPLSQPPRVHAGFLKFTSVMLVLVVVSQSLLALVYLSAGHQLSLAGVYLSLLVLTILAEFGTFCRINRLNHPVG